MLGLFLIAMGGLVGLPSLFCVLCCGLLLGCLLLAHASLLDGAFRECNVSVAWVMKEVGAL